MEPTIEARLHGDSIVVDFGHLNIFQLILTVVDSIGYKDSAKVKLQLINGSGTLWEFIPYRDNAGLEMNFEGYSEMLTITAALKCAALILELRNSGRTNQEILEVINTEFNENFGHKFTD